MGRYKFRLSFENARQVQDSNSDTLRVHGISIQSDTYDLSNVNGESVGELYYDYGDIAGLVAEKINADDDDYFPSLQSIKAKIPKITLSGSFKDGYGDVDEEKMLNNTTFEAETIMPDGSVKTIKVKSDCSFCPSEEMIATMIDYMDEREDEKITASLKKGAIAIEKLYPSMSFSMSVDELRKSRVVSGYKSDITKYNTDWGTEYKKNIGPDMSEMVNQIKMWMTDTFDANPSSIRTYSEYEQDGTLFIADYAIFRYKIPQMAPFEIRAVYEDGEFGFKVNESHSFYTLEDLKAYLSDLIPRVTSNYIHFEKGIHKADERTNGMDATEKRDVAKSGGSSTFESGKIYNGRKADGKVLTFKVIGVAHDRDQICFLRARRSALGGYFFGGYTLMSLIDHDGNVEKSSLYDEDGEDIFFSADDISDEQ